MKEPRHGSGAVSYTHLDVYKRQEDRQRILRLIEAMTIGSVAVGYLTESMHGAGSPQAQRIMIGRQANMEAKKALARRLCGIDPDGLF